MKTIILIICLLQPVLGQDPPKEFAKLETTNGRVYEHVTVRKIEPDGISIMHADGSAKIVFEQLPEDVRRSLGYDPEKSKNYNRSKWEHLPKGNRFSVTPKTAIGCQIEYRDAISLIEKVKLGAKQEMLKDKYLQMRLSSIAKGGEIWFTIRRLTIGAADTEYFVAIVTDPSGNEIARDGGRSSIAEVPNDDGLWWNVFHVCLPIEIQSYVKVRLVDRLGNKSADFTITRLHSE